jgi:Fuc2NAc and GlcNAc transferase
MGDAGSTAIGFFLASVPFASSGGAVPILAVVLALYLFVLDATTTLLRRLAQGERWYTAHRTHVYQRLLAHGVSHARITYSAYAGMAAVAGLSAAYPGAGPGARWLMFLGASLLFVGYWLAVRNLERRAAPSLAGETRRPRGGPVS